MEKHSKKWFKKCIFILLGILLFIAILVWVVDPYFHFHKPFSFIRYRLSEERYINDGISRHFEYDAIVTGTSMTQNFKITEVDEIFDTEAVKEPFSGAGYQELSENLDRAISRNSNIRMVIWGVDYNGFLREYDWTDYDNYPTYLYDDNALNDVSYIFNKDVLYHGVLTNLMMTIKGEESTTMDDYSTWDRPLGYEHVMENYDRSIYTRWENVDFTDEDYAMVYKNIYDNIVSLANKYPDVEFIIFYPPYSICYWDSLNLMGTMERQFEAEELATSLILECDNVKLYNFFDQYDIITDLSNYRDFQHYGASINSKILEWISNDVDRVTKENYLEKLEKERKYYGEYDYESIFIQE